MVVFLGGLSGGHHSNWVCIGSHQSIDIASTQSVIQRHQDLVVSIDVSYISPSNQPPVPQTCTPNPS